MNTRKRYRARMHARDRSPAPLRTRGGCASYQASWSLAGKQLGNCCTAHLGEVVDDRQGQCLLRTKGGNVFSLPVGLSLCQEVIEADPACKSGGRTGVRLRL
jgi:hypothetical protein